MSAQEILFPSNGGDSFGREANQGAATTLANIIEALPEDRQIRILAMGGGTGGTTRHLIPVVPHARSRYVLSDMSAAFHPMAERRFGNDPAFSTATLDVTKAPDVDRLGGPFDVAVAANAVHATPDLAASLANVRRCLAPNGILILAKAAPSAIVDFQFGALTGYCLFQDSDLRKDSVMLTSDLWPGVLTNNGFDGVHLATQRTEKKVEQGSPIFARAIR